MPTSSLSEHNTDLIPGGAEPEGQELVGGVEVPDHPPGATGHWRLGRSTRTDLAAVTREEVREVYWRVAALSRVVFTANPGSSWHLIRLQQIISSREVSRCGHLQAKGKAKVWSSEG